MKTLYGFWKYDLFPYCVGGELTNPVKGKPGFFEWMGTGCIVKPFLVTTLEDGRRLDNQIKQLVAKRANEENTLKFAYDSLLAKIIEVPK